MTSLSDQLKSLALPITSSYVVDKVRRKSLIYDDPSRVDTLSCYQKCSQAFKRLCYKESFFIPFEKTLFAETSIHLELCTLLPAEKEKLDNQVVRFLCYISPYLKHLDALVTFEWLVYKFEVHLHYFDDYIRCIIPYHETGLFPKFIQLLDLRSLPSGFQWIKHYADSGRCISRQEFARLCTREHTLIPFLCTTILTFMKHCADLPLSHVNDMTNFFLVTVTALCDSGLNEKKLVEVVDGFQGVIHQGLRSINNPPFQSAALLVVIRLSLKLSINSQLILDWISCIVRKTRPGKEWESIKIIIQLMRDQGITNLPPKISARYTDLMSKLTQSERLVIEEEEAAMMNQVDVNKLAAECAQQPFVRNVTQFVEVPIEKSVAQISIPLREPKHLLLSHNQHHLDQVHAFLKSIPDFGLCIMSDCYPSCSCPTESLPENENWLCNILLPLFPNQNEKVDVIPNFKCTKTEIRFHLRSLSYIKSALTVYMNVHGQSNLNKNSSKSLRSRKLSTSSSHGLLEKGIDQTLPLLAACLSHSASLIRTEAYDIMSKWLIELFPNSIDKNNHSNSSILYSALNISSGNDLGTVFSEEIRDLLQGDCLSRLDKAACSLLKACTRLLFSQPLNLSDEKPISETQFSFISWSSGLCLLNEDTLEELFLIPVQSGVSSKGWPGVLQLIRSPDEPFTTLHNLCCSRLNERLFAALGQVHLKRKDITLHQFESASSDVHLSNQLQYQLLDALYELANLDIPNLTSLESLFSRLSLNAAHFDYILVKADSSKIASGNTRGKSLFTRVIETREARRRSLRSHNVIEDSTTPSKTSCLSESRIELIHLRFISFLVSILTEAVPRLQSKEISSNRTKHNSIKFNQSLPDPNSRSDNSISESLTKSASASKLVTIANEVPVHDLFTPLINHLMNVLNLEQRLKQSDPMSTKKVIESDSSDSDGDDYIDDEIQLSVNLPTGSKQLSIETLKTNKECSKIEDLGIRSLLRHCTYRILVCMTSILTEINKIKRPRKRHLLSKGGFDHPGLCGLSAAQAAVDPIFLCLTIYPDWGSLHQQILLCFVELSSMFPSALCDRLVSLVQWVACSPQLMRLDTFHNLNLLGRLIVIAVPALIQASSDQVTAALHVLSLFVCGFSEFPSRLSRRRLALYTGLVRGLAHVSGPMPVSDESSSVPTLGNTTDKNSRKQEREKERIRLSQRREGWLSSWLWVISVMFLNKDWESNSVAEEVGPFLIDLFNQFSWDKQVGALCECLGFLLTIYARDNENIHNVNSDAIISVPGKRRRLTSGSFVNDESNVAIIHCNESSRKISPSFILCTESLKPVTVFVFNPENAFSMKSESFEIHIDSNNLWSLTNRVVQFLLNLISSPNYSTKVQSASDDPLGLAAVYIRLVQQIVRLMISASSFVSKIKTWTDSESVLLKDATETITNLQSVLIQVLDCVPDHVFISMLSDLFESTNRGLRRKALELLASKLTNLTINLLPAPILTDFNKLKYETLLKSHKRRVSQNRIHLEQSFEYGLVQFMVKLTSQYSTQNDMSVENRKSTTFGSSFSRLSLSCLRDLAKLLADRYPGEFMRTVDTLIASPGDWWPSKPKDFEKVDQVRGSALAESRSLVCLFFVECLQRLPPPSLYPEASATMHRLSLLLHFAMDHASTCICLSAFPCLSIKSTQTRSPNIKSEKLHLIAGTMHSREQHLQASLTLITNLLELAVVHRLSIQNDNVLQPGTSGSLIGQWLQFDFSKLSLDLCDISSVVLLRLLFFLNETDLSYVTGCNPERSGSILRQITSMIKHIYQLLIHVTELKHLLGAVQCVINMDKCDWNVINGALSFLAHFGEAVAPIKINNVLSEGNKTHLHHITMMNIAEPELMWNLFHTVLITIDNDIDNKSQSKLCYENAYCSISCLLASLPSESRFKLCQQILYWATSTNSLIQENKITSTNRILTHLSTVFRILERLSSRISCEDFSELSKQLALVDCIIVVFIVVLSRKQKGLKKLASRLNLKDSMLCYANGVTTEAVSCVRSALSCLKCWLQCEHENNLCLDAFSGGQSVLMIPSTLVSLLDLNSSHEPLILEDDLMETLSSFLRTVASDEGFLRPLGSALAEMIMHATHWRTRLAAIRLLKFTFNQLTCKSESVDPHSHGSANCLLSDALTALSEALEDNKPEVEEEANRLFAELEQIGLTTVETNKLRDA